MREYTFKNYSQEEIIAGIRENNSEVLNWLYQSQYPKVEKYVMANGGNPDYAKDIFQEAFVVVWKKLRTGDFVAQNGTAVAGFLYQVAKNKWLDTLKSSTHKNTVPLEVYHEIEEEEHDGKEFKFKQIEASFKKLGANCKEVLTRFYFEKQPLAKIAQAFDWTEATARNNKYRCIQRLRENMISKTKPSI